MAHNIVTPVRVSEEGVATFALDGEDAEAVREYIRLSAIAREAEVAAKAAREALEAILPEVEDGTKQIVEVSGIPVLSRTVFVRDHVGVADLREHAPEVFATLNKPIRVTRFRKA